jgi:hypothetical protein
VVRDEAIERGPAAITRESRDSLQTGSQLRVAAVRSNSWESKRRRMSAVGSRYQEMAVKTVTENTSLYVIVICKV